MIIMKVTCRSSSVIKLKTLRSSLFRCGEPLAKNKELFKISAVGPLHTSDINAWTMRQLDQIGLCNCGPCVGKRALDDLPDSGIGLKVGKQVGLNILVGSIRTRETI